MPAPDPSSRPRSADTSAGNIKPRTVASEASTPTLCTHQAVVQMEHEKSSCCVIVSVFELKTRISEAALPATPQPVSAPGPLPERREDDMPTVPTPCAVAA